MASPPIETSILPQRKAFPIDDFLATVLLIQERL